MSLSDMSTQQELNPVRQALGHDFLECAKVSECLVMSSKGVQHYTSAKWVLLDVMSVPDDVIVYFCAEQFPHQLAVCGLRGRVPECREFLDDSLSDGQVPVMRACVGTQSLRACTCNSSNNLAYGDGDFTYSRDDGAEASRSGFLM